MQDETIALPRQGYAHIQMISTSCVSPSFLNTLNDDSLAQKNSPTAFQHKSFCPDQEITLHQLKIQ